MDITITLILKMLEFLMEKHKFLVKFGDIIEGPYSPIIQDKARCKEHEKIPMKPDFITSLFSLWRLLTNLHYLIIEPPKTVWNIRLGIALCVMREEYSIICLLVHIVKAYIFAYEISEITEKIPGDPQKYVKSLIDNFTLQYVLSAKYFNSLKLIPEFSERKTSLKELPLGLDSYLRSIKPNTAGIDINAIILMFDEDKDIMGLRVPFSVKAKLANSPQIKSEKDPMDSVSSSEKSVSPPTKEEKKLNSVQKEERPSEVFKNDKDEYNFDERQNSAMGRLMELATGNGKKQPFQPATHISPQLNGPEELKIDRLTIQPNPPNMPISQEIPVEKPISHNLIISEEHQKILAEAQQKIHNFKPIPKPPKTTSFQTPPKLMNSNTQHDSYNSQEKHQKIDGEPINNPIEIRPNSAGESKTEQRSEPEPKIAPKAEPNPEQKIERPPESELPRENKKAQKSEEIKDEDPLEAFVFKKVPPESIPHNTQPVKSKPLETVINEELDKSRNAFFIDMQEVQAKAHIGSGASAEVYKGIYRGTDVAVKVLKTLNGNDTEKVKELRRELTALLLLRNPNLVLFMGAGLTKKGSICLVTEFCEGGTLFKLLHESPSVEISWKQRCKIALDVAKGMNSLHSYKPPIIHRDLKSLNLLLVEPITGPKDPIIVKITDFGLARFQGSGDQYMTGAAGTFHWMAPEVLMENPNYTTKADVYSYGIVLWEILTRRKPYEGIVPMLIPQHVLGKNERPDINLIPKDCPPMVFLWYNNIFIACSINESLLGH